MGDSPQPPVPLPFGETLMLLPDGLVALHPAGCLFIGEHEAGHPNLLCDTQT